MYGGWANIDPTDNSVGADMLDYEANTKTSSVFDAWVGCSVLEVCNEPSVLTIDDAV